jgi:hypothetical protein
MRDLGKPNLAILIHISRLCKDEILGMQAKGEPEVEQPVIGIGLVLQLTFLTRDLC